MNETHVEQSGAKPLDYAGPDVPDPAPPKGGSAERETGVLDVIAHIDPEVITLVPPAAEATADVASALTESSCELAGSIFDAIAGSID